MHHCSLLLHTHTVRDIGQLEARSRARECAAADHIRFALLKSSRPSLEDPAEAIDDSPAVRILSSHSHSLFTLVISLCARNSPLDTMLGRVVHYAVDAVLISTVVAGVRRSSGFTPETNIIPDPTLRLIAERYLGIGETIFDMVQGSAVNSEYFRKDTRR
ncbi:hypothetical protein AcV7_006455 [Taiwanofungus camphoratus]|nr:hypothetical protein AcV7_006455 [Antrodia cinnamomea]